MRILITGSRDWDDFRVIELAIFNTLDEHQVPPEYATIVHGDNPLGADFFASVLASTFGTREERHPAMWNIYGKSAGPIRNLEMIELGADICLAFIKDNSPGASHCALAAKTAGIPTYIWRL